MPTRFLITQAMGLRESAGGVVDSGKILTADAVFFWGEVVSLLVIPYEATGRKNPRNRDRRQLAIVRDIEL